MWENGGANRAIEAEATDDLPRRGLQWQAYQDGTLSWKEVPSHHQERDLQDTGTKLN